mmetsp:Transcript_69223/g.144289  ORF Transcript_69223/g.144289 Transcript_69223/m.144289 type:complete len:82 (-) Transcript_69223:1050-1295(-)
MNTGKLVYDMLCLFFHRFLTSSLFRHVVIPPDRAKLVPSNRLMNEGEWRGLGIHQSRGWVHYSIHKPEPHIILFRRLIEKK